MTGGGSQLANLRQLFEYMTGMDTRIGYPNEPLGKGKIDTVKSPMFATAIGLVLSGFKALDIRDAEYAEIGTKSTKRVRDKQGTKFFQNILEKTKGLLIDDIDDQQDY